MIKKQKRIIIIALIAVVVLAVTYIILANTVLKNDETPSNTGNTQVNLYDRIESEDLMSVAVKNSAGSFRYYRGEDGDFYFEGAEALIYDSYMTALLSSGVRSAVATREVTGYDADALSVYGLSAGAESATVTVTAKDGTVHVIRLGSKLVDSSGFYAMTAGSDKLYVLDNYYGAVFNADLREFIAPQVANPVTSSAQGIALNSFALFRDGDVVVRVEPAPEDTDSELMLGAVSGYVITEPESRPANDFAIALLLGGSSSSDEEKVIGLNAMTGTKVAEYSVNTLVEALKAFIDDETEDPASSPYYNDARKALNMLVKYGMIDSETWKFAEEIEYTCGDDYNYLIAGKVDENGNFYVYSQAYDVIVEFPADQVKWLFWELDDFSLRSLFSAYVYDLQTFEITSPSVSADFAVESVTGDSASITSVKDRLSGTEVDQALFKQLFRCFLQFDSAGTIEATEGSDLLLTVRVVLKDGSESVFNFYDTEGSRKSWYTVDGVVSGYYVNRDYVKDLIEFTGKTLRGEQFTAISR